MKPVQIVLLMIAGALGGAILTRTWNRAEEPRPVTAQSQTPATAPVTPAPAPVVLPAAPSVTTPDPEPDKPSPVARREASKPRRTPKPAPPPANPRPIETARVEPPPAAVVTRPEPAPAPVESVPPARVEPEPQAPPPPPPAPNQVTLKPGLLLPVRLVDGLTSERNAPGDTFTGTLDRELVVNGFVVAERGARVEGRVVEVDRGGKVRGVAFMSIHLTRIYTADGQTIPVETATFERRAEASRTNDAAKVGGGAALGAIIGAIAGGGKGAAIGAAAGGGAGAGAVLATRGKAITFPSETRINFRLDSPVTVTERR